MKPSKLGRLLSWYTKDPGTAEALVNPQSGETLDAALLRWYDENPKLAEAAISETGADDE